MQFDPRGLTGFPWLWQNDGMKRPALVGAALAVLLALAANAAFGQWGWGWRTRYPPRIRPA